MRKWVVRLFVTFLVIIIVGWVVMLLNRFYGPTVQSFTAISRAGELQDRQVFLTTVFPIIPKLNGYRVLRLNQYRTEAPYIEIRDCFPYPYIELNKIGKDVIFRNSGNSTTSVSLLGKLYTIAPGQKKSLSIIFPAVPVLFEYHCNGSSLPAGFIYAVSK